MFTEIKYFTGTISEQTFFYELPPSLGPAGQLVTVCLLYLGPLLQASHQIVAEPVAVVESLDSTFVVPYL